MKPISWCERNVSKDGIRLDPARFSGLKNMQATIMDSQLQRFVCEMNLVCTDVLDVSSVILPCYEFWEGIYRHVGKQTSKGISRFPL